MVEDMKGEVRGAYSRRAAEYAAHLGSMVAVHPADRQLMATWADRIKGPAIDAGCGLGHWTNYLDFARVLRPGSDLLLGFFEGPTVEKFEHTVVAAYRWPVSELCDKLRAVDFDVIETLLRTGPRHRPHGAIIARRRASR